jgi:predicted enzyme related to lactoylglutathione lyase
MEMERYEHGVPSWVDVSSPDLAKTAAFYSALFGWDCPEGAAEFGGYRVCTLRGKPVAGMAPLMDPAAPRSWTTYVNVANADRVVSAVNERDGTVIVAPMDVGAAGRMGVFADSAGAAFAVWQPNEHRGAQLVNEPNTYCWSELMTTDVAGAVHFYAVIFGWGAVTNGDGPTAYTEFKMGGRSIAGCMQKPATLPPMIPPMWNVYFTVTDADAAAARIKELGGNVMMGPQDVEPGRFVMSMDPTGAAFGVMQFKETPA